MKALPGRAIFRLGGAPGAWVIKTVRVKGEDVTESGFDFKPTEDVSNVEIELTNQPTTLTGAVTDNKGQPSRDYVVVVFSQDRERWTPTTRMINVSRPDQEGRFRIRVPGGNYYGAALDYLEPGEQFDPEFLNRLRDSAVTFVLNSGETKTMDLRVIEHP